MPDPCLRRDGCEDTEGKASPHPFCRAFGGKELNLRADVNGDRRQAPTVQALKVLSLAVEW